MRLRAAAICSALTPASASKETQLVLHFLVGSVVAAIPSPSTDRFVGVDTEFETALRYDPPLLDEKQRLPRTTGQVGACITLWTPFCAAS
jgi:hypothetical protein